MTGATLMRTALIAGLVLLVVASTVAAIALYTYSGRHAGADYTSLASNLVRAQHETARFAEAAQQLDGPATEHYRQVLDELVPVIQSRRHTAINALERSELPPEGYQSITAEFDTLDELLPELKQVLQELEDNPERTAEVRALAAEIEWDLAYVYSELHEVVHAATAEQRRLVRGLTLAVIGLLALLLLVAAVLVLLFLRQFGERQHFQRLSHVDPLTGLDNRRTLVARAEESLAEARRSGHPVSVAILDLDDFKAINDRYGHPAGDTVLKGVGELLQLAVRKADAVARAGGEEFALIMPNTNGDEALELCRRVSRAIEALSPDVLDGDVRLSASIGVCAGDTETDAPFEAYYACADAAMYRAKQQGGGAVVVEPVTAASARK